MPHKWTSKSDGQALYNGWNIEHNPAVILTEYHDGHLSRPDTIEKLERTDRYGKLSAAHLAIEQAVEASSFDTTNNWLERAIVDLQYVSTTDTSADGMDGCKARALFDLAQLPLTSYMACFGELPPTSLVEKAYDTSVETVDKIAHSYKRTRSHILAGLLAEAGVILLGQRYAIREFGDGSWLPTHSLHSEDHANQCHHDENRAWDVTVHTDVGDGPEKSYLVQVKSSSYSNGRKERYTGQDSEGIITVRFNPDLTYRSEGTHGLENAVEEIVAESGGQSIDSRVIDNRTEKLLDALG